MDEKNTAKKEIEVITGDDSNLKISPVYSHLKIEREKQNNKPKDIVIPKSKKENNE